MNLNVGTIIAFHREVMIIEVVADMKNSQE